MIKTKTTYKKDSFMSDVQDGIEGRNEGLPNGFTALNQSLYNTQRGRYYLIGAASGVGKTTLADYAFVFTPYMYCKEHKKPLRINYFSFEIGKNIKRANWAARLLEYRYKKRFPVNYILSHGKLKPSIEHQNLFASVSDELEEMMNSIDFVYNTMTPLDVFKYLFKQATDNGEFVYENYVDADEVVKRKIVGYKPHNPEEHWIVVMDHIALIEAEKGLDLKRSMDRMSTYFVFFRNICNMTIVVIQQYNSELGSIERQKFKKEALAPQIADFGDTKYTYRDADVVLGLLKPIQFDMSEYMNYDISQMGEYAIWMFLMKNRYGPSGKAFGLVPDPIVGKFYELPKNNGLNNVDKFYDLTANLQKEESNNNLII